MYKNRKTYVYVTEALKTLQDEVAGMRRALRDSLKKTMRDILGVRERVVE